MSRPPARSPTSPLPTIAPTLLVDDPPRLAPSKQIRLLVVDDEPFIRSIIGRLFRENEVVAASSGDEALAFIQQGGQFDAVICDAHMPLMTGLDLHRRVRSHWPDLARRFVFLTGGSTRQMSADLGDFGTPVMDKPFVNEELRRVVLDVALR